MSLQSRAVSGSAALKLRPGWDFSASGRSEDFDVPHAASAAALALSAALRAFSAAVSSAWSLTLPK
jgi:hypothetical protein